MFSQNLFNYKIFKLGCVQLSAMFCPFFGRVDFGELTLCSKMSLFQLGIGLTELLLSGTDPNLTLISLLWLDVMSWKFPWVLTAPSYRCSLSLLRRCLCQLGPYLLTKEQSLPHHHRGSFLVRNQLLCYVWDHPYMISAKFLDFWTSPPLAAFGTAL